MPSRSQIAQALAAAWTPQDRAAYRQAVGGKASMGGAFAQCLREAMRRGTAGVEAYRRCAEQANIGKALASVWAE
jgi:hypothetical protein